MNFLRPPTPDTVSGGRGANPQDNNMVDPRSEDIQSQASSQARSVTFSNSKNSKIRKGTVEHRKVEKVENVVNCVTIIVVIIVIVIILT